MARRNAKPSIALLGIICKKFLPESDTAGGTKGRRQIQPAEREPRRRPNGDILHAQCEDLPKIYCPKRPLGTIDFFIEFYCFSLDVH